MSMCGLSLTGNLIVTLLCGMSLPYTYSCTTLSKIGTTIRKCLKNCPNKLCIVLEIDLTSGYSFKKMRNKTSHVCMHYVGWGHVIVG